MRHTHKENAMWGEVSISQMMSKIARKPPGIRSVAWIRISFTVHRGNQALQLLDVGLPSSRTVGEPVPLCSDAAWCLSCKSASLLKQS